MKKDITLVILAAGMGSRFGGLKQIEPMGPNGEFIIDYSVYDAIKAGFNKIVFLIKRENYDLFKETIGARVEPYIKTEYAFQELNNLPLGYTLPSDRVKPLGTAHAVLCCKEKIHENFAMINSDDFYGRDAFIKAYDYLSKVDESSSEYGMIGYKVANTLTENGSVKRGVCNVDNNGYLTNLTESKVERVNNEIIASPLDGSKAFTVKWKKAASDITGYQVRYSTSKKFSSASTKTVKVKSASQTSTKVTGLKAGKTYYVQVRAYTSVDGKNYYSAWSDASVVVTK